MTGSCGFGLGPSGVFVGMQTGTEPKTDAGGTPGKITDVDPKG